MGWNTEHLGLRIGADALSAASASALVSPLICVIDRSIVSKAATNQPFRQLFLHSLRPLYTTPHRFLASRPFLLIFSLYFSTYLTANTMDTFTSTVSASPASTVSSGPAKFLATSAVNLSLCVYKDSQFARMFNPTTKPTASIPRLSYLLFSLRDSLTIFASFNLPPLLAPHLAHLPLPSALERHLSLSLSLSTESRRATAAQFLAPAAMQLVSTPVHLLGLDLFNRPGRRVGWRERARRVGRDWAVSTVARMGRIVPAFGVGGVVNGGG